MSYVSMKRGGKFWHIFKRKIEESAYWKKKSAVLVAFHNSAVIIFLFIRKPKYLSSPFPFNILLIFFSTRWKKKKKRGRSLPRNFYHLFPPPCIAAVDVPVPDLVRRTHLLHLAVYLTFKKKVSLAIKRQKCGHRPLNRKRYQVREITSTGMWWGRWSLIPLLEQWFVQYILYHIRCKRASTSIASERSKLSCIKILLYRRSRVLRKSHW